MLLDNINKQPNSYLKSNETEVVLYCDVHLNKMDYLKRKNLGRRLIGSVDRLLVGWRKI